MIFTDSDLVRFWGSVSKLSSAECWLWTKAKDRYGYGVFWHDGKNQTAHRASKMIQLGALTPSHIHVCHTCDVPACVNPDHLWLGSHIDNVQDKVDKNRHLNVARGETHVFAILTEVQVSMIMHRLVAGDPLGDLALTYNVHPATISAIKIGDNWRHLAGADGNPTLDQLKTSRSNATTANLGDVKLAMDIKYDLKFGTPVQAVADKYNVSQALVHKISVGKAWASIGGPTVEEMKAARLRVTLTESVVRDIKRRLKAGEGSSAIAAVHNLSASTVSNIKSGKNWSHITLEEV